VVANIGLNEMKNALAVVYSPNPTSDFVQIDFSSVNEAKIEVLDATGKVIINQMNILSGEKLDLRNLERGVYFVRINSDKGSSLGRVVKN